VVVGARGLQLVLLALEIPQLYPPHKEVAVEMVMVLVVVAEAVLVRLAQLPLALGLVVLGLPHQSQEALYLIQVEAVVAHTRQANLRRLLAELVGAVLVDLQMLHQALAVQRLLQELRLQVVEEVEAHTL
jgi:hypothetical protein